MNPEKHNYEFKNSYLCFSGFIVMLKTGLLPNNEWLNSYFIYTCRHLKNFRFLAFFLTIFV